MSSSDPVRERYWQGAYETLAESTFHERVAAALVARWQRIDLFVGVLVGVAASGSAIAGWAVWTKPGWRAGWLAIAGAASVASIFHASAQATNRIKDEQKLNNVFAALRAKCETFVQRLVAGMDDGAATEAYNSLREKLEELVGDVPSDIAATKRLSSMVQKKVRQEVKERMVEAKRND